MNNPWNDELDILSAENVHFSVEAAGLGSRFSAALIDLTLQGLIAALLMWVGGLLFNYVVPLIAELGPWALAVGQALLTLLLFVLAVGYYCVFEWLWDGQTPGKRWLGLRVMQTSGMPITAWDALVRNILRLVDFLPMLYGAGALVAVLNPHNRRIGDLVAGTLVARERHDATRSKLLDIDAAADAFLAAHAALAAQPSGQSVIQSPTQSTPQSATQAALPAHLSVATLTEGDAGLSALLSRLNDQDIELLHEFLTRRARLKAEPRLRLARSLAARLCARLQQPLPPEASIESWLESLSQALMMRG
jgi:uncharacterized RDD family membrane protein YckC